VARMGEESVHTGFWWETPKERDNLKDQGLDGGMESEWILWRLARGVESGSSWLRIRAYSGLLYSGRKITASFVGR
jgi:hypothetical protein